MLNGWRKVVISSLWTALPGVDIGVKQAMYQLIYDMKKAGKAILMISEEMAELIGMADRLIVMKDFEISKEFPRSESLTETDIIEYMI